MRLTRGFKKTALLLALAAASIGGASAATGSLSIGGTKVVADLGADGSGTGWTWTASTATLTLSGTITGNIDIVNTAGDVTVTVPSAATLSGQLRLNAGNLTLNGRGKLIVDYYSDNVAHMGAIDVRVGGLTVADVTLDVTNTGIMVNHQAIWTSGDFRMASGSLVTTSARGIGVLSNNGSIYVSGTASLTNLKTADNIRLGYGPGNGLLRAPGGSINISGGTVTGGVTGGTTMGALVGIINITGGTVNVTRGGIWGGDVTVGGATAVVRIEGDILATGPTGTAPAYTGSLTVSGGTVTVNGRLDNTTPTVAGMITVTGGNVTIDGRKIEPGVVYDENNLMVALRSTSPSTITLGNNITLSTQLVEMGADHKINVPSGYTLGVKDPGRINVNGHSLSLEGSGRVNLDGEVFGGTVNSGSSTLNITDVSVFLRYSWCVNVISVNVNGGTVNFADATKGQMIFLRDNTASLNINGGTVNVQGYKGSGIENVSGTVHVNGGTLILRPVGDSWAINNDGTGLLKYTSGLITGYSPARIQLTEGSKVEGMGGLFYDRGTIFTANGTVTVGARDAAPSATGLSSGTYAWNGSMFVRNGIFITDQPQDKELTEGEISGNLYTNARTNHNKIVYFQWHKYDPSLIEPAVVIPGEKDSDYTLPTDLAAGTHQYVCKMTAQDCDDEWTRVVTVTVKPATYVTITHTRQGNFSLAIDNRDRVLIDWGDGVTDDHYGGNMFVSLGHNYAQPGVKTITIRGAGLISRLDVTRADATAIDVSAATALRTLDCSRNPLETLTLAPDKTLTMTPTTGGSVSVTRVDPQTGDITLAATADESYSFTGWTGDATGTESSLEFTLDRNMTVEAMFEQPRAIVEAAKTAIEEAAYTVYQAVANTEDTVETWLAETIGALLGTTNVTVGAITITNFEAAEYGANGSFSFTVALSRGDVTASATGSGTISATPVSLTITAQPAPATTVVEGNIEGSLTVEATSDAPISYQWYSGDTNSNEGGAIIEGATRAEFVLPTDLVPGTYYYYVVVTAQGAEPVTSSVAVVTVAPVPAVPLFMALADEYIVGADVIPLKVVGIGSTTLSTFRVDGVAATEFNPSEAGVYLIEASSADGKLKIWKYVTVK